MTGISIDDTNRKLDRHHSFNESLRNEAEDIVDSDLRSSGTTLGPIDAGLQESSDITDFGCFQYDTNRGINNDCPDC